MWSDGSALTYTNWSPGEPYRADAIDCAQMFKDGGALGTRRNGQWKLQDCALFTLYFICEKQAGECG